MCPTVFIKVDIEVSLGLPHCDLVKLTAGTLVKLLGVKKTASGTLVEVQAPAPNGAVRLTLPARLTDFNDSSVNAG